MANYEINLKAGDRLVVKTPTGEITIFHGEYYRCITSYAKDMRVDAFYTEGAKKQTSKPFMEGSPRLVSLTPKEDC